MEHVNLRTSLSISLQVEMRDFREEQQRFEEELARCAPEVPEDEEMDVDDREHSLLSMDPAQYANTH